MKIALAFFGITRSLKYTIKSIKRNILQHLKESGIDCDIFMHTYKINNYANIRTKEKPTSYNNNEYKLLNPKYIQIDVQEEIKKKINMSRYRTHKDPWNTGYNSVDNFILAQYSKGQVVKMIDNTNINYDYIMYVRPDCLYTHKLNVQYLRDVDDTTICIPNFHLFGPHKFNDRFCITNMKTYKFYGNTFDKLLNISKQKSLHSERVLGELMNNYDLKIIRVPFIFLRVRCNGSCEDKDKELLTKSQYSSLFAKNRAII
uniref:Glycosyltransferase n=1 Tax=viral metagenome TaxID=1070528 RepID=A0A6C0HSD7_9ZZZZ